MRKGPVPAEKHDVIHGGENNNGLLTLGTGLYQVMVSIFSVPQMKSSVITVSDMQVYRSVNTWRDLDELVVIADHRTLLLLKEQKEIRTPEDMTESRESQG